MLCEETKTLLSIYVDDAVTLPIRASIDEHLGQCPVCRSELAGLRLLKQNLRALIRPIAPLNLAESISEALMIESAARRLHPRLPFSLRLSHWLQPKLMPYTVASFASVVLFVTMFAALRPHIVALREAAFASNQIIFLEKPEYLLDLNEPVNYAASRAPFAEQSHSLNPRGALAELTRSYVHPQYPGSYEDADDMVVVADVFSNGSASLAGVVQAPRDRRMLADFESALRRDAAFVPASFDRRPDTMRVVFSVQKVDVRERNF
jgi:hypothetical protein